jgi:hypothetical protein
MDEERLGAKGDPSAVNVGGQRPVRAFSGGADQLGQFSLGQPMVHNDGLSVFVPEPVSEVEENRCHTLGHGFEDKVCAGGGAVSQPPCQSSQQPYSDLKVVFAELRKRSMRYRLQP